MNSNHISAEKRSLPKGGGAVTGIGETFQPNAFMGTASLTIPIPVSPCRGFEPHLSLDYSSGSGNGIFGIGFGLSIPNISRKTARAFPKYDDTDTFLISNADDLVPVEGGPHNTQDGAVKYSVQAYRPRTEGLFARIEKWVNVPDRVSHWRLTTKDNVTTIFGESEDARIADPVDKTRVFQWLIERTCDTRGNKIIYQYKAEEANKHISRIKYGNDRPPERTRPGVAPASDDWHFEVDFEYSRPSGGTPAAPEQERPDPFSSYKAGFLLRTSVRCIRISMFHRFKELAPGKRFNVSATHFDYCDPQTASALTLLKAVRQVGYREGAEKALPPLEFTWSPGFPKASTFAPLRLHADHAVAGFLAGGAHQMVDLHGEGLPGILYTDNESVLYSRPLGNGTYAESTTPEAFPIDRNLQHGDNVLMDLGGEGKLDLVVTAPSRAGYYELRRNGGWEPYRSFSSVPTDLRHPQRQMVDVTGDGLSDLLLFEEDAVKFYPSKGKLGYDGPHRCRTDWPLPVTTNPSAREAIHFADLFGDGGSHLVRIRNGSVECWPNLGYGRFGKKVEIANAPRFDGEMDASRLFLTDIDGSGTTDLVYAYPDRIDIYRNESGNRFSDRIAIHLPRPWNDLSQITFADVLGNGTACLVFTSIKEDLSLEHQYCDFTGGVKPHLLIGVDNNMGATTLIDYSPSTKFYLVDDEKDGTPWITRLPFPVQVVEKIETVDHISGSRLVASYTYHHGYFDPIDREFRGFGRVERRDAETFDPSPKPGLARDASNDANDGILHVPTVLTKTWYHTGAYAEAGIISQQFSAEYYQGDAGATPLPDSILDAAFQEHPENTSEAYRALHGQVLREEVYALDHEKQAELAKHPYTVTESNFQVRLVQPKADRPYAVCLVHSSESISYHYECNPTDPRVSHSLTLEVDEFGNVLKQVAVGYGRRQPDNDLSTTDQEKQTRMLVTYNESRLTNAIVTADVYLTPLPCETCTYELTGYTPTGPAGRFQSADIAQAMSGRLTLVFDKPEVNYEDKPASSRQRRLIEHVRTLYRKDDLTGLLPLGVVESLALHGESYKLAFTPGLLAQVFQRNGQSLLPDPASVLGGQAGDRGGYLQSQTLKADGRFPDTDADDHWWIPSGRMLLSPNGNDTAMEELAYAKSHFFLPHRTRDPFHTDALSTESLVTYDAYDLLIVETRDALGNISKLLNDYRVLKPCLATDPNGNRTAVVFDALGMVVATAVMGVVATAVMGKESETLGDLLEKLDADPSLKDLQAFVSDPQARAASLLGKATTRIVYDLDRYQRAGQPPFAATLARETHMSDPDGARTKIQIGFAYSDGFGRAIQSKIQAEPGDAPQRDAPVQLPNGDISPGALLRDQSALRQAHTTPRWVGTGRTVFNNKGNPVKQYEPFFSSTHLYEAESEMTDTGVTSILFYDALERVVATLHPNHTFGKVVFDPWRQETWDVNDTVLTDPKDDPDAGEFFRRLPAADYLPTWHEQRRNGQQGADEQSAADNAAAHAATPTVTHFDALGRPMLTSAENGKDASGTPRKYATRVIMDIEGNQRELIDANGRIAMRYDYDMLGNRIHEASMDAGERWMLNDVLGKSLSHWDSKDRLFRTGYDQLRRPTDSFMRDGAEAEMLIGRIVYGETVPSPEANNTRGQVVQVFDQAGVVTHEAYDFKGNVLSSRRQLAVVYWKTLDWSSSPTPALEEPVYTSHTRYDALNRPMELTAPDNSVIRPTYNEASLLERVDANVRGATVATVFVSDIAYDAKRQRARIDYGNGVSTTYEHDPTTFRLARLRTTRASDHATLQDLRYTYDPAGNITHIRDDAKQTIFFKGQVVRPECDYAYDAIYRLINATGREHIGQAGKSAETTWNDALRINLAHPNDGQAMRNYAEQYVFDAVGNLEKLIHQAANGNWTRTHTCSEPSLLEPGQTSNRLTSAQVGKNAPETFTYDAHGNMMSLPHLSLVSWDCSDQLRVTAQQSVNAGTPEKTWYVYDAGGQRVRQVSVASADDEKTPVRTRERLYLRGFEIYREYETDGVRTRLERETLHVMDDEQRIALVETRIQGNDKLPQQLVRYQFGNHLGSASLELDDQARIISYEEYTPFGSTSYQAVRKEVGTPKRYRYSGKERDDATGLYYYGARYYAPWLARWMSPDPAGTIDGSNLYAFVRGNPTVLTDALGFCGQSVLRQVQESLHEISPTMSPRKAFIEGVKEGIKNPFKPYQNALLGYWSLLRERPKDNVDEVLSKIPSLGRMFLDKTYAQNLAKEKLAQTQAAAAERIKQAPAMYGHAAWAMLKTLPHGPAAGFKAFAMVVKAANQAEVAFQFAKLQTDTLTQDIEGVSSEFARYGTTKGAHLAGSIAIGAGFKWAAKSLFRHLVPGAGQYAGPSILKMLYSPTALVKHAGRAAAIPALLAFGGMFHQGGELRNRFNPIAGQALAASKMPQ